MRTNEGVVVSDTVTGGFSVTPDSDMFTGRCAFDVLSVHSVLKSLTAVTRADRRLREVNEVICVRQSVLRQ